MPCSWESVFCERREPWALDTPTALISTHTPPYPTLSVCINRGNHTGIHTSSCTCDGWMDVCVVVHSVWPGCRCLSVCCVSDGASWPDVPKGRQASVWLPSWLAGWLAGCLAGWLVCSSLTPCLFSSAPLTHTHVCAASASYPSAGAAAVGVVCWYGVACCGVCVCVCVCERWTAAFYANTLLPCLTVCLCVCVCLPVCVGTLSLSVRSSVWPFVYLSIYLSSSIHSCPYPTAPAAVRTRVCVCVCKCAGRCFYREE